MNRQEKLQDALEWVETLQENYGGQEETQDLAEALGVAAEAIKALKQTRLIPVSARLPEVGEKVLCQCQANIYEVLKLTADGWYHDKNHCYMLGFVVAWMPLPEPYKAESEESE